MEPGLVDRSLHIRGGVHPLPIPMTDPDDPGSPPDDAAATADVPRRAKETFYQDIRNLRHEFRTPLNHIFGYADLLLEEAEDLSDDAFSPDLEKIRTAANRLLELVDDVFDLESSESTDSPTAIRRAEEARAAPEAPTPARETPARSGRILVVDDNEANRDVLARRLEKEGFAVRTAEDGPSALRAIFDHELDLVFLDVVMPGMTGLEVLSQVRSSHAAHDLPIIMATARDQSQDVVQALRLGANDYVTKPLDFPVVLARADTQLALKRANDEIQKLAGQLELRTVFIRKAFGRYVSDEVVDKLLATPEGLHIGGERRRVTVLMSDLRAFTAMSERLTAEEVVRLLNHYLAAMVDVVTKYGGTVEDFMGDGIIIVFGSPILRPDDAERAVACALEMQLAMDGVNAWNRANGLPEIEMGIGLNTGEVVVGNIGSRTRTKFGVIGAAVNLASRVESYTVGGQILVSSSTHAELADRLTVDTVMEVEPKGVPEPIQIYGVTGLSGTYELSLTSGDDGFVAIEPLPFRYTVMDGKHSGEGDHEGQILELSERGARVRFEDELPALYNIRGVLTDDEAPTEDFYAKVVRSTGDPGHSEIRFTSLPPDLERRFRATRGR